VIDFRGLVIILVSAVLVNNYVLQRFLGICPFLGVSKKIESAVGMSIAVVFVITVASVVCWLLYYSVLVPANLGFLRTIVFILVIAALVQFVEMVIRKVSPSLFQALGIYLPLITTNCAVLGAALLSITKEFNFLKTLVYALGSSVGFGLVLVMFAGIRQRLDIWPAVPRVLRGMPIALVTSAILALAFLGFTGLVKM